MTSDTSHPAVEIDGLTRRFGPIIANDAISLDIARGEIVGLVGENGAGKSTLLAMIGGYIQPDAGMIRVDGERARFRAPADAIATGIVLVHQHLSLVPTFTVLDQLRLVHGGMEHVPAGIDPHATLDTLSMGGRQRVEIARALAMRPRVLLLDEPTSILAPEEIEDLFRRLNDLRDRGVTVVIVSHKIHEVVRIADRVQVMRYGRVVDTVARRDGAWPSSLETRLLGGMFGEAEGRGEVGPRADSGATTTRSLYLNGFSVAGEPGDAIHQLDLVIPGRRLVGIVGIDGNGQRALAEALCGYRPRTGTVELRTTVVDPDPAGSPSTSYLSGDRLGEACIPSLSLGDNLRLKYAGWTHFRSRDARALLQRADVRPDDPAVRFDTLSGGNMQRALVARELATGPDVIVAENPVQGLDRRAAQRVWSDLREYARADHVVIVLLSDLDDALEECDEIATIAGGKISQLVPRAATTREHLGKQMIAG